MAEECGAGAQIQEGMGLTGGLAAQAGDLVDIFVGSASSAEAGAAAGPSLVEHLLDTQVLQPATCFLLSRACLHICEQP